MNCNKNTISVLDDSELKNLSGGINGWGVFAYTVLGINTFGLMFVVDAGLGFAMAKDLSTSKAKMS